MSDMDQQQKPDTPWEFRPNDSTASNSAQSKDKPPVNSSFPLPQDPLPAPTQPSQMPSSFAPQPMEELSDDPLIRWTASEFIHHEKSLDWYLALAVIDIVVAAITYLVLHDMVTTVVVIIAGISLGFYAGWKPNQKTYTLSASGLTIGQRFYGYDEFQAFSKVEEGAFSGIQLTPLKRFSAPVNMYYDPKDEEVILGILGDRLPMQEAKHDLMDNLIKRIRF